ncbi:hypothetical protein [Agriterribacter sp.]|uniref:hypothetical protein n=1 Tax=Agriterribacter sp. TaxID=2821509 RepID=UPI002BFF2BBD|nr:hypothetical protein [Agriterribacter sp.]HTN06968.1 hypothetical protein [Agriterribacter sp.]
MFLRIILLWLLIFFTAAEQVMAQPVGVSIFNVNVTPPVGSPVACAKARAIVDSLSARVMEEYGLGGISFDTAFLYDAVQHVADAVNTALKNTVPVTHLRFGEAVVQKVTSNRSILGEDGKVAITRWSKMTDAPAIAAQEGLISS